MDELSKLPNVRTVLEELLLQVGIETSDQLRHIGSKEAWLRMKAVDPPACYNRLCALEGAIQEIRWHDLPGDVKSELILNTN